MIRIKSLSACNNPTIPKQHQWLLRQKMQDLIKIYSGNNPRRQYNPDVDGHLIYIEPEEDQRPLTAMGLNQTLDNLMFEGVKFYDYAQCFEAILVTSNSFAYQFIVPKDHISAATQNHLQQLVEES